jgi:hypothetical protein
MWEIKAAVAFAKVSDIIPQNGSFRVVLEADAIYSVTTTAGQGRGAAAPPPAAPFPFPYADDFESVALGKTPKYLSDQEGAFEVAACKGRRGKCLRQVIAKRPIPWQHMQPDPFTFLGSADWSDYEISVDALIEAAGNVALVGRIDSAACVDDPKVRWASGYVLTVRQDGSWELNNSRFKVAVLKLASGKVSFQLGGWHHLSLAFKGAAIRASIDGAPVANVTDTTHTKGMGGIGTGWNKAQFDNFCLGTVYP